MIAPETIDRVEQLLAEGRISQRAIAKLLNINRGTVGEIASGRRPDYEELRRKAADSLSPILCGPPARCGGCGAMIVLSVCVACEVRLQRQRRTGSFVEDAGRLLELDLDDECRSRYEETRAKRQTQGKPLLTDQAEPSGNGKTLGSHRRHTLRSRSRRLAIY